MLLLERLRKQAVFTFFAWTKLRSMVSDRWENTYSCKSGASAASHAKLHAQLTAQSGVTRFSGQIMLRERGERMKWKISRGGWRGREPNSPGPGSFSASWTARPALCHLRLVSYDAGQAVLPLMICTVGKESGLSPYHSPLSTHTLSYQKPKLLSANPHYLKWSNLLGYYCT